MPSKLWLKQSLKVKLCRLLGSWMPWLSSRLEYHMSAMVSSRAATSDRVFCSSRLYQSIATSAKLPHHVPDLVALDLMQQQLALIDEATTGCQHE